MIDSIDIDRNLFYKVPDIPNFILPVEYGHNNVPIHEFTDAELQSFGEAFTKNLIEKAQQKRKQSVQTKKN